MKVRQEIRSITKRLEPFEDDVKKSLYWFDTIDDRMRLINGCINDGLLDSYGKPENESAFNDLVTEKEKLIGHLNSQFWGLTWPVHETHFHKSFAEFIKCPFTTLIEVIEVLRKITGDIN